MNFEERRSVRSAFSSTAGGFVAAVTSPRGGTTASAPSRAPARSVTMPATDGIPSQTERRI